MHMRGRATAEIRQLRGVATRKSPLLLRRGHSILESIDVTCDPVAILRRQTAGDGREIAANREITVTLRATLASI
jgi:hypothetical protein